MFKNLKNKIIIFYFFYNPVFSAVYLSVYPNFIYLNRTCRIYISSVNSVPNRDPDSFYICSIIDNTPDVWAGHLLTGMYNSRIYEIDLI